MQELDEAYKKINRCRNLNQKIKRGSLNSTELWKIADVLGCQVVFADKRTGKVII